MLNERTANNFWGHVDIPNLYDCWVWKGAKYRCGYGLFGVRVDKLAKSIPAHRFSWFLHNGPLESSKIFVCHRCDNKLCVNPSHLFAGSHSDNMRDMIAKGRNGKTGCRGERNSHAKLRQSDIGRILRLIGEGLEQKEIAKMFMVGPTAISRINKKKAWREAINELQKMGY